MTPMYRGLVRKPCASDFDHGLPPLETMPNPASLSATQSKLCVPVLNSSKIVWTIFARFGSGTMFLMFLSWRYPMGALPGHPPLRSFSRTPLITSRL
jgi:hypothetical protein